ncbi:TPA: hypothetical protein DIV48_03030 [Candidatus Kaiserbacteria bacterium]|nr:hypothetical protein [Candidatus Kaiserbacteria bacterium]
MNLRYKKALVFVLAGVVYLVGQYFRGVWFNPSWPFPCQEIHSGSIVYCNAPYLDTLGWPLIALGQMLAIVAVVLLFANAVTFQKWLKFSAFYIPIAVVLDLLIYPIRFSPLTPVLTHSQGVYPFGWLYVLITFGIVFWSFISGSRRTG